MLLLKATRDEEAYNAFMRAYGDMMRGRGGLFASVPDTVRGQNPYEQDDDEWKHLEDLGIYYNSKTGEAFKETYLEDEDDYEQTQVRIPTPVGAGLEGKVFRIPRTNYVAKIPMTTMNSRVRGMAEGAWNKVMRSPLEAWWSQVLNRANYPVNPYSVFTSRHPLDEKEFSLNLVQPYVDEYHPDFEGNNENSFQMNAIHEHLFNMQDIGVQWEDMKYEMERQTGQGSEPMGIDEMRELAEDYPLYEDTDMKSNMFGNVVLDYISNRPFIEDEYGGLLEQEEIDRLLEAALIEQQKVPKRYQRFGGNIDRRIQTIIDELMESKKQGRLVGSSINFADDRVDVGQSNFGRGFI